MKHTIILSLIVLSIIACKVKKPEYIDKSGQRTNSTLQLDTTYVEDEQGHLKMVVRQKQQIERRKRSTSLSKSGKDTTYVEQEDGSLKMIITG